MPTKKDTKKVHFVTGSSGFIGKYLVNKLLADGEVVWVLIRPIKGMSPQKRLRKLFPKYVNSPQLKVIEGDITKEHLGIRQKIQEEFYSYYVCVWHLAADLTFRPEEKENAILTNIKGTQNVVEFANINAQELIHVSTIYVLGDYKSEFYEHELDVGQSFRNNYEYTKFEAEKVVRTHTTIPFLVYRPSIVIGDMYEGKAEGCTFGYYRYAFMLYTFREWLKKTLNSGTYKSRLLRFFGTREVSLVEGISTPWFFMPFPSKSVVDMVPVDYVVKTMINIQKHDKAWELQTFHIIQNTPPESLYVLKATFEDLNIQGVHYFRVSPALFRSIIKMFYILSTHLRRYINSALWYMPYVTEKQYFNNHNTKILFIPISPKITRDFLNRINYYAEKEVFRTINLYD